MIIIRHSEECAGKPNGAGFLTGKCNCQTAKLDKAARKQLGHLLGKLAEKSLQAGEESEYFALRLDELAEQITKDARGARRTAKRADMAARKTRAKTKAVHTKLVRESNQQRGEDTIILDKTLASLEASTPPREEISISKSVVERLSSEY